MVHSDFIVVHLSTSANACLSVSQQLCTLQIFVRTTLVATQRLESTDIGQCKMMEVWMHHQRAKVPNMLIHVQFAFPLCTLYITVACWFVYWATLFVVPTPTGEGLEKPSTVGVGTTNRVAQYTNQHATVIYRVQYVHY